MNNAWRKRILWRVCLGPPVCLFLIAALAFGQPPAKRPIRTISPPPTAQKTFLTFSDQPGLQPPRFIDRPSPDPPIWMEFSINWTNCQFHRVDDSPLEAILSGAINGSNALFWNLSTAQPQVGAPPILYYVENIFGNTNPSLGSNIPLTWEIALDGGPFAPMTLLPDNTLTATFPPGPHTFQVRITGTPVYHQADGYYHLQLTQCLIPQL